ncbi:hypothetical protein [Aquabacterium sp.]|uniref:hypothetical protein n=1 Tax=Aquabacterium sp. TaxID=1872578 RepID=UPI0025BFA738|nr:hypothetical protein [Aquabacterium sp.]
MTPTKLARLPILLAALAACAGARADYTSPDGNFRLSGFGTLGYSRSTSDDALFNYPGQGGGSTRSGSFDPDSKFAMQGSYKFTPTVSATAQLMTKYDAAGQYVPSMEWAFAKWQATPTLSVRAGRIGAPFFMISDFRDVGYANTTVRPPLDVYGQVPVSQFEGADASYQLHLGSASVTTTLWTGNSEADFASSLTRDPSTVKLKRQVGLNVLTELSNGLSLRLGRSQGKLSVTSQLGEQLTAGATNATLLAGLAGYGATSNPGAAGAAAAGGQLAAVVDLLNPNGVDASFTGIGLGYDQDNWVAGLEYTKRKTKSYIPDTTGWYGFVGYRVGSFTPYVGASQLKVDRSTSNPVSAIATASSSLNTSVNTIAAGTNILLGTQKLAQRTSTLGVRWDASPSTALKFQYDRIAKPADSNGLLLVADPTQASAAAYAAAKKTISVLTLSVDFVF